MFMNNVWCLKSLCYRASAVISQILLSVTSEELCDRCWECKSLAKAFCYFVLNPDVTYQPGLPGSSVIWASTQQHRRDVDRALLLAFPHHLWGFPKFRVLEVQDPYHIYLFTIAMARRSTTGVTRKGVRRTEGVLSVYWHKTLCEVCRHTGSVQGLFSFDHTASFAFCRACFNTKEMDLWKEWASVSSNKNFL